MGRYRKKPIVIEAFQMTKESHADKPSWPDWLRKAWGTDATGGFWEEDEGRMYIRTLEGVVYVTLNDWIIKGIQGELYPCRPHIFNATYEAADG